MKEHHIPPLYERLRPEKLEDFVGQKHLIKSISTILKATFPPNILFFWASRMWEDYFSPNYWEKFLKKILCT